MKYSLQLYMYTFNKHILNQESQTGLQKSMSSKIVFMQEQKDIYLIQSHLECLGRYLQCFLKNNEYSKPNVQD